MNLLVLTIDILVIFGQVGESAKEESLLEVKAYAAPNGTLHSVERQSLQEISSSYKLEGRSSHTTILKKNDQIANQSVRSDTSARTLGMEDHFNQRATLLEAHEALHEPGIIEHSTQQSDRKFAKSSQDPSASILDKIFGSVIPINVGDSEAPVMVIFCTLYQLHCSLSFGGRLAMKTKYYLLYLEFFMSELKLCLNILCAKNI